MALQRIKINRILVPTDFSELSIAAFDYAVSLAARVKADIVLLHVVETYGTNSGLDTEDLLFERVKGKVKIQMEEIKGKREIDPSIRIYVKMEAGKIHSQIREAVTQEDIDLVVMGTHGITGINPISRFFLGSNTNRTVQLCPVPVLTLRNRATREGIKDILLPLDLTQQTDRKVGFVINLAKLFEAKVHLLAVSDYFETLTSRTKKLNNKLEKAAARLREEEIEVSTEVIKHDNVAHSVVSYAEEIDADLVVIVTAKEGSFDSLIMGSRAGRVIASSAIPVLSVRPQFLDDQESA